MLYRFDSYLLDTARECVEGPHGVVPLRPQTFAVLRLLVERAPALVTHQDILQTVWGHSAISDSAVAQTIKELRQAFGDAARAPRYIETRPRRGYRMAAAVQRTGGSAEAAPVAADATATHGDTPDLKSVPAAAPGGGAGAASTPRRATAAALVLCAVLLASAALLAERSGDAHAPAEDITLPADPAALRAYDEGAAALARHDARGAIAALVRSLTIAPGHAGAELALAEAHALAGDSAAALAVLDEVGRRSGLSRRERLRREALVARLGHRWEEAEAALVSLQAFYPELETGLQLLQAQIAAGSIESAGRTLQSLQQAHAHDARTALAAAYLAHARQDFAAQRDAAATAAAWAQREGAAALAARALVVAALAELRSGELGPAREAAERARAAADVAGDERSRGDALLLLASVAVERAELAQAEAHVAAAQQAFAAVGHQAGEAEAQRTLGIVAGQRGALGESLAAFRRAESLLESIGDRAALARVQGAIGTTLARSGDPEGALAAFDRAREAYALARDRRGQAGAWNNRGMLLAQLGRRAEAQSDFDRALEAFGDVDDRRGQAVTLGNLAALAGGAGQVERAIELNHRALAIFAAIGADADAARLAYNLALAEQRRGALDEAQELLQRAAASFGRLGTVAFEAAAWTALGELQLRMGAPAAAAASLGRAQALELEDPMRQASTLTLAGRIALAQDRAGAAREAFAAARSLRARAGATAWVQASELDLAELALAEGEGVTAEQHARALAEAFGQADDHHAQAQALHLLAESLRQQSRDADALRALAAAREAMQRAPDAELSLRIALLQAQLSEAALAEQRLRWIERTAAAQGFRALELQAALLLGHLQPPNGSTSDARLLELESSARGHGLLRLARLARESASG